MRRILHHNLITNPKPATTAGWSKFGNVELRMTSNQTALFVRNIDGGGSKGVEAKLDLPAGDWWIGLSASAPDHTVNAQMALIKTGETDYPAVIRVSDPKMAFEWYTAPFHLERDGCKLLLVAPAKSQGAMSVRHLIIAREEDWTRMIAKHVQWFDGDAILTTTTPGGLDSLATQPHTLAVAA